MNNLYKKDKFLINNNYSLTNNTSYDIKNTIENENKLISSIIEDKEKSQIVLCNILDPDNYSLNYSNNKKDISDTVNFYYNNKDKGPGRGFGNLNISNDIRNGDSSRLNTKILKKEQESTQLFDFQFSYLDKNFQDPHNIVMPIPRGGESTRTQNQLNINKYRIDCENNFEFKY